MNRFTTDVFIFDKSLKTLNGNIPQKGKFPFSCESITFDIENKTTSKMQIVNHRELILDFNNLVRKGDYVYFLLNDIKYFGSIEKYNISEDYLSAEITIALNYDALDGYKAIKYYDITRDSQLAYPGPNEVYSTLGGYKTKIGLSGMLLLYAKQYLDFEIPFADRNPLYMLSDLVEEDERGDFEDLFEEPATYSELVRLIANNHQIKTDVNIHFKRLDEQDYHNLPQGNDDYLFISVVASKYKYLPLQIDAGNVNDVIGDLDISFQSDLPNLLDLEIYHNDDVEGEILLMSSKYLLCKDGVIREMNDVDESMLPDEIYSTYERYDYDLSEISNDVALAYAVSKIGNNYANEIQFKTTRERLDMTRNEQGLYSFYDLLGRPVIFKTGQQRVFLTRITSITIDGSDFITVKLGASRRRLTDLLKRRLK